MTIILPLPPSINSYHRSVTTRSGVSKVLVSREGRSWRKKALQLAAMQGARLIEGEVGITITAYFRDRRRDLDNVCKPTLDLLETAGLIENDRRVQRIVMLRRIDRGNPRVVVEIAPHERAAA